MSQLDNYRDLSVAHHIARLVPKNNEAPITSVRKAQTINSFIARRFIDLGRPLECYAVSCQQSHAENFWIKNLLLRSLTAQQLHSCLNNEINDVINNENDPQLIREMRFEQKLTNSLLIRNFEDAFIESIVEEEWMLVSAIYFIAKYRLTSDLEALVNALPTCLRPESLDENQLSTPLEYGWVHVFSRCKMQVALERILPTLSEPVRLKAMIELHNLAKEAFDFNQSSELEVQILDFIETSEHNLKELFPRELVGFHVSTFDSLAPHQFIDILISHTGISAPVFEGMTAHLNHLDKETHSGTDFEIVKDKARQMLSQDSSDQRTTFFDRISLAASTRDRILWSACMDKANSAEELAFGYLEASQYNFKDRDPSLEV